MAHLKDNEDQCDQMAILFLKYLTLYNIEFLPNSIKVAKGGSQFCQMLNKRSKIAKD